jgi:hypothetical protein
VNALDQCFPNSFVRGALLASKNNHESSYPCSRKDSYTCTFILTVPPIVSSWDLKMHYKCWYIGSVFQKARWWLNTVETCCVKLLCLSGIWILYKSEKPNKIKKIKLNNAKKKKKKKKNHISELTWKWLGLRIGTPCTNAPHNLTLITNIATFVGKHYMRFLN